MISDVPDTGFLYITFQQLTLNRSFTHFFYQLVRRNSEWRISGWTELVKVYN